MARMHFRIAVLLLLGIAGSALAASPGKSPAPDIQQRHDALVQLETSRHREPENVLGKALAARFRELYPDATDAGVLRASSESSLHLRLADARMATFYHPDANATDAMLAVVAELHRRGAATREDLVKTRNALLAARRFDDALEFGGTYPGAALAPLPRFVDAGDVPRGRPSVWRETAAGRFDRVGLDLGPAQVLVMAGCHFSGDAAREIAADPVLGPAFRAHATWLGMPPGNEDPADVAEWNRAHPQAPMLTLYDRDEWPMFPQWRMPTFFVMRDGRIIGSVVGWKPADAREALIAMLREAGLLPHAEAAARATQGSGL
jgi:hypothetical protein